MPTHAIPSFSTSHLTTSPLDHATSHSKSDLQRALAKCQASLSGLEKWEFAHYKKSGFLSWIARLILLIMPSSRSKLGEIEKLEIQIEQLLWKAPALATTNPPSSGMKFDTMAEKSTLPAVQDVASKALFQDPIAPALDASTQSPTPHPISIEKGEANSSPLNPAHLSNSSAWRPHSLAKPVSISLLPKPPSFDAVALRVSYKAQLEQLAFLNQLKAGIIPAALSLSDESKSDKALFLEACAIDGEALIRASVKLKTDKEVVLAAVTQNGNALFLASHELKADRAIVLVAVIQKGEALCCASKELQADKAIALAAVTQDGDALKWASIELRADKEVVLAAVKKKGAALRYARSMLKADKEVVGVALIQTKLALYYASPELKADREFVLMAVKRQGCALFYANIKFRADKEIVLAAVTQNSGALKYASDELQADDDIIHACKLKSPPSL